MKSPAAVRPAPASRRVIGFAHRGAPRTKAEDNTLPAFEHALELGAQGLEADIALTADGVPVLVHPHLLPWRRMPVSRLHRHELPPDIPALADLYARCGSDFELSLDMGHPEAAAMVVNVAEEHEALDRLWLTYWRLPTLERWRTDWPHVRLVYPTVPLAPKQATRLIGRLADMGVDAMNIHHRFCRPALVACAKDAGLLTFAWGVRRQRALTRVLTLGVDGVFCDNVEDMVQALHDPPVSECRS